MTRPGTIFAVQLAFCCIFVGIVSAAEPERFLVVDAALPASDISAAIRVRVAALL